MTTFLFPHMMPVMRTPFHPMAYRHSPCAPCGTFPWTFLLVALLFPATTFGVIKFLGTVLLYSFIGCASVVAAKALCHCLCRERCGSKHATRCYPRPRGCARPSTGGKSHHDLRPSVDKATRSKASRVKEFARNAAAVGDGDDRKNYYLTIQAPGVRQDDLLVSAEGDFLIVRGETTVGTTTYGVNRIFRLPRDADMDGATATHSDGVLELLVPVKGASKQSPPSAATKREPTAPPSETPTDAKSGNGSDEQVLTEAEPDEANIQLPQEETEELQMEGTDIDTEAVGEMDAYLAGKAGYECDDMKVPSERSSVTDVQSDVDDAGLCEKAATAVLSDQAADPMEAALNADDHSDWEDLMDDLNEMGFANRQSNLAALEKHSGSIKQAVKELVNQRQFG